MLHRSLLFIAAVAAYSVGADAADFDKPLRIETASAAANTHYRCEVYRGFVVQMHQYGSAGGSFDVVDYDKQPPGCGEEEEDGGDLGYWRQAQVRGVFIFLNDATQPDQQTSFEVFDTKSWRSVLRDVAVGDFLSVRTTSKGLVATYRRSVTSSCSVYYGTATACWSQVRSQTGLGDTAWSICRESYDKEIAKNRARESRIRKRPATLSYLAELTLGKGTAVVGAKSGPITCKAGY